MADPERAHVLVVDDSPTLRTLMESVLAARGLRVTTAQDGAAGLSAARGERPDLIVLDDLLPDLSTQEFCAALAELPTATDIPILLVVGKADGGVPRPGRVTDAIARPFTPDALLAVVDHLLRAPGDAAAARSQRLLLTPAEGVVPAAVPLPELGSCTLAGDLAAFPLSEVLALLRDRQRSGTLSIVRERARLQYFVAHGMLQFALAMGVPEEFLLGRFLVERGFVTSGELRALLDDERRRHGGARVLGQALAERGLVTAEQLQEAMRTQTSALVFEGIRWIDGRFALDEHAAWPEVARAAALGLAIDPLLLDGLRRIDEWRVIEREIGDFDAVYVREEERFSLLPRGALLRDELIVARLINGRATVRELIAESSLGSFEVSKVLFRLLRGKLIRRRVAVTATGG